MNTFKGPSIFFSCHQFVRTVTLANEKINAIISMGSQVISSAICSVALLSTKFSDCKNFSFSFQFG